MSGKIIIKKPIITENSINDAQKGVFTFEADVSTNKNQIRAEIENLFNVHVDDIRTQVMKGKIKKTGKKRLPKKEPDYKKVRVTLRKGEKIEIFDIGSTK